MDAIVVITRGWAMLVALAALLLLLAVAHVLIVSSQPATPNESNVAIRRRGIKALVIGHDGRASTSKVQAVLWTFAILYAFVFLLVWGRSLSCAADVPKCDEAAQNRTVFSDLIARGLQADYYVLLGFPVGVAVAARALTTSKVASGTIAKTPNEESSGVTQGLRETISNDEGETDLLDFQYFAFNLLTLAFFFTEFLAHPDHGLPDLPATLIGLSGLSAAAYTTKKALETQVKPGISAVIPRRLALVQGTPISIVGSGFGDQGVPQNPAPEGPAGPRAWVKLDGSKMNIEHWSPTRIDATLPQEFVTRHAAVAESAGSAELVVDVEDGSPSDPFTIELVASQSG